MRTCHICGAPEDNHPYRHAFTSTGKLTEEKQKPAPPPDSPPSKPSSEVRSIGRAQPDVLLRMALIRAGVITLEQLEEIERELKVVGYVATGPNRAAGMGEPRGPEEDTGAGGGVQAV